MFKLIKVNNDRYRVIDSLYSIEGAWDRIEDYLKDSFDVEQAEIDFAVEQMTVLGHDTAHFGIGHTFTHTSNSVNVSHIVAELRAIQSLRREFEESCLDLGDCLETREVHGRLISLYSALNVEAVINLIDPVNSQKAA